MTTVIKRDGKKERFDEAKLKRSIEAAAREARLPDGRVTGLADEISKNVIDYANKEKEIRSTTLRENILDKLDGQAPEVSRAWRDHDRRAKGIS